MFWLLMIPTAILGSVMTNAVMADGILYVCADVNAAALLGSAERLALRPKT